MCADRRSAFAEFGVVRSAPDWIGLNLKITGEQTIRTACELHHTLAEHVDRGMAIDVDLSEVSECDTAALQLICAFRRSMAQRNQPFHISAVSPAMAATAAMLGLNDLLADADGDAGGQNGI